MKSKLIYRIILSILFLSIGNATNAKSEKYIVFLTEISTQLEYISFFQLERIHNPEFAINSSEDLIELDDYVFKVKYLSIASSFAELMPCCEIGRTSTNRLEYDEMENSLAPKELEKKLKFFYKRDSKITPDLLFLQKNIEKGYSLESEGLKVLIFKANLDLCRCEWKNITNYETIKSERNYIKGVQKIRRLKKKEEHLFENYKEDFMQSNTIKEILDLIGE